MKRWYWAFLPIAACVSTLGLGSSSCIQLGPSDDADAGDDADAATTSTVQSQCSEIWTAYCARTQECYGQDPQLCLDTTLQNCCGLYCSLVATSSEKTIATCVSDINSADCDSIDVNEIPASCHNVPTH